MNNFILMLWFWIYQHVFTTCKSEAMRIVSGLNGKHLMISGPSVSSNNSICLNLFNFKFIQGKGSFYRE